MLEDGTVCDIMMNRILASRWIGYDETEYRQGTEKDAGGTRSGTYTNEKLNRGGSRSTRSANQVTGGHAVTVSFFCNIDRAGARRKCTRPT